MVQTIDKSTELKNPPRRFEALEAVLNTKRLRVLAPTIRHIVSLWIPDEERVNGLVIETTVRSIVLFLEKAPGLQAGVEEHEIVSETEIEEHLRDEGVRTALSPCIVKVIQKLRYGSPELYSLRKEDFRRLEHAIVEVRQHLHIPQR